MLFVALTLAVVLVELIAGFELPLGPIAAIIGVLAFTTLLGWLRLRIASRPIHNTEIPLQLCIDVGALTGLLYFTGGWTNPLVSLYLVPIAAAAAMLPAPLAWLITFFAMLCYALVAEFYQPLLHHGGSASETFNLHVSGMWLTFVIAATLIAYFGTTMAATLRARAQALATAREANLRNEQIIAVATLAAGTAHELSTPLGTIAVIANDLRSEIAPHQRTDIDLIISQIEVCKDILRRLRNAAAPTNEDRGAAQNVRAFIDDVRERFHLLRPTVNVEFSYGDDLPGPSIAADPTLHQAVLSLLNNAVDASPHSVECSVRWTSHQLVLDICDRGAGFDAAARAAEPFDTPHRDLSANGATEGMGLGLLLANATIERLGGSVHIAQRDRGGTWVQVLLQLPAGATAPA